MDLKIKAVTAMTVAVLAGCGGSDNDNSVGGEAAGANVIIKTQNASSFAMRDNKTGSFEVIGGEVVYAEEATDCTDFVRAIESGDVNMPSSLAPAFEYPHVDSTLACRVNSAVATKDNLYLQGDFWNFSVAPEVDEDNEYPEDVIPTTMSCNILKIPMFDAGHSGEEIECLAQTHINGVFTHQSEIALDSSTETLYFTSFLTSDDSSNGAVAAATLYSHSATAGLNKAFEGEFEHKDFSDGVYKVFLGGQENGQLNVLVEHGGLTLLRTSGGELTVVKEFSYDTYGERCYSHGHDAYGCDQTGSDDQFSAVNTVKYGNTVFTGLFTDNKSNVVINLSNGDYSDSTRSLPFKVSRSQIENFHLYGDMNTGDVFTLAEGGNSEDGWPLSRYAHDDMKFGGVAIDSRGGAFAVTSIDSSFIYYDSHVENGNQFKYELKVFDPVSDYEYPQDLTALLSEECHDCDGFKVVGSWSGGAVIALEKLGTVQRNVYLNHKDDFSVFNGQPELLSEVFSFQE